VSARAKGAAVYYPTYSIPVDTDADTASWLQDQQGDGPLDLPSVTDVCARFGVSATLRDDQGSIRGHVDGKGDWRLS
jgi:hypothetical protein